MKYKNRAHLLQQVENYARADGKAAYFRLHRHRFAAILAALESMPNAHKVLEVGITPGQCTTMLVNAGYHVSGVDLDPSPRRALWERLGIHVCKMNVEHQALPFANHAFDWVVFSEVIEHLVYSPLPVLREFQRVLVPGGRVLITTPNELYLKSRLRSLMRMLLWQSFDTSKEFQHKMLLEGDARYTTHSRTYTMRELCWVLEQAGFQVVQHRYVAAWEKVGVEAQRILTNPHGVLAKSLTLALTSALPTTRSMLLVVGENRVHSS